MQKMQRHLGMALGLTEFLKYINELAQHYSVVNVVPDVLNVICKTKYCQVHVYVGI